MPTYVFSGNKSKALKTIIQVFRAFDWPSTVSGSKVVAKKPLFCKMQNLQVQDFGS